MKNRCRKTARPMWRKRQNTMLELLRHARVVTDPNKLASLAAKLVNRKQLKASRCAHQGAVFSGRSVRSLCPGKVDDADSL